MDQEIQKEIKSLGQEIGEVKQKLEDLGTKVPETVNALTRYTVLRLRDKVKELERRLNQVEKARA